MNKISELGIEKVTPDELIGPLNDIEKKFAPPYLFLKGNRKLIDTHPRVSIIGTRHPSEGGINNTSKLTKFLLKNEVVIVSGLALGIDTVAHKTAIENGGRTIAVLGTPLNKYYPKQNSDLQDEIARDNLVISQFSLGSAIQRKNFPLRNRTMALLSHVSIIVEAGEGSGTIHQGWEALRLGRPLFLIEDIIKNKNLKWPHKLIGYGAKILPISQAKFVLESLPVPILEAGNYATF